jgi:predicted nucleic acid-binding Zn ribbon protein
MSEAMPIYVYEVILEDGRGGDRFEVLQSYNDPELTKHPETGQPVRRVIQAPRVAGKWSDLKTKSTLSDRNLADKGFTKYVKTDQGRYEKTTGSGPDRISAD